MNLNFKKTSENLFFKSPKANDDRMGSLSKSVGASDFEKFLGAKNNFIIAGYPDDEGIRNNSGRPGARLAPEKIREFFYKMTPAPIAQNFSLFDIGDLETENSNLTERHDEVLATAEKAYRNNCRWIGLGGGHDYGYPDAAAFIRSCKERPLLINFDAHLDVRPTTNGINSGTPFFRVLEEFSNIDFVEIGIQSQCNSAEHLKYAADRHSEILHYDDIRSSELDLTAYSLKRLAKFLQRRRKCFLSIDIDSFSSAYAPGCSQSFATGFAPDEVFKLISHLNRNHEVCGIGIYECSPPLDIDHHTSKLAALIIHKFIFGNLLA